ncbi:MAG: M23 family metallopeptidase [archaeon]
MNKGVYAILALILIIIIIGIVLLFAFKPELLPIENKTQTANTSFEVPPGSSLGTICIGDECKTYCPAHQQQCIDYCMEHPENELCIEFMKANPLPPGEFQGIPGICETQEECMLYCESNPSNPYCQLGGGPDMTIPELAMPFGLDNYSPNEWGIWPFCAHGGDHPEGHGGTDFELKPGTEILAACDGNIEYIEYGTAEGEHGSGVMLMCGGIVVSYHGFGNILVHIGDQVTKGQVLGYPVDIGGGEYYVHFEVNDFHNQKLMCPLDYLDSSFRTNLDTMFLSAHYPEQAVEPNLCNCDWLPYKENMARGP